MLYVVPTPIGNLSDITLRAVNVLKKVDLILAEDTRVSKKLLNHYNIKKPLQPYHSFNEHRIINVLDSRMEAGEDMALISDAGTPGISDPGFLLIRHCLAKGIRVECLPGPTAFIPALICSGLACDRFHFEGFLPHKKGRKKRLLELSQLTVTLILYESPHRIIRLLKELIQFCGPDRNACLCREISKLHEEQVRGTLEQILTNFSERNGIKGEIVLVIAGID
jgi:16S rRNA (cytidine1402-2'-O)-methyltransferase